MENDELKKILFDISDPEEQDDLLADTIQEFVESAVGDSEEKLTGKIEEVKSVISSKVDTLERSVTKIKLTPGPKGEDSNIPGPQGPRGSKFLGSFDKKSDLPDVKSYQQGDFAVVDGTIWYII